MHKRRAAPPSSVGRNEEAVPKLSGLANECVYAQNYISEKESAISKHFADGGRHSPNKTTLSYVISEMEDAALTYPGIVSILVTRP